MNNKTRLYTSLGLKFGLIIATIIGLILSFFFGFTGGATSYLYFTTQSNIWIAVMDLVMIVFIIIAIKNKTYKIDDRLYIALFVFTISILLTGLVYNLILAPAYFYSDIPELKEFNPYNASAIFLHMVTPIIALVDYLLCTTGKKLGKLNTLWAIAPPAYYLVFSIIGFYANWDFGRGNNFPYFFLNFGSPAGFFGFSDEMPYFMGSFYWLIIILATVLGISYLLRLVVNYLISKRDKK